MPVAGMKPAHARPNEFGPFPITDQQQKLALEGRDREPKLLDRPSGESYAYSR
jgi:hypothetical protein